MAVNELKRWTLDRCPDCSDDPALTHKFDEPVEVVAIPDLVEWLRQRVAEEHEQIERGDNSGVCDGRVDAYQAVLDLLENDE